MLDFTFYPKSNVEVEIHYKKMFCIGYVYRTKKQIRFVPAYFGSLISLKTIKKEKGMTLAEFLLVMQIDDYKKFQKRIYNSIKKECDFWLRKTKKKGMENMYYQGYHFLLKPMEKELSITQRL